MPDLMFDAVVCGGGNKALMLAMYLAKYAGMSVGIFERRHEIGGGLAAEETSAPGVSRQHSRQHHPPVVVCTSLPRFPRLLGVRGAIRPVSCFQRCDYQGQWQVTGHL